MDLTAPSSRRTTLEVVEKGARRANTVLQGRTLGHLLLVGASAATTALTCANQAGRAVEAAAKLTWRIPPGNTAVAPRALIPAAEDAGPAPSGGETVYLLSGVPDVGAAQVPTRLALVLPDAPALTFQTITALADTALAKIPVYGGSQGPGNPVADVVGSRLIVVLGDPSRSGPSTTTKDPIPVAVQRCVIVTDVQATRPRRPTATTARIIEGAVVQGRSAIARLVALVIGRQTLTLAIEARGIPLGSEAPALHVGLAVRTVRTAVAVVFPLAKAWVSTNAVTYLAEPPISPVLDVPMKELGAAAARDTRLTRPSRTIATPDVALVYGTSVCTVARTIPAKASIPLRTHVRVVAIRTTRLLTTTRRLVPLTVVRLPTIHA